MGARRTAIIPLFLLVPAFLSAESVFSVLNLPQASVIQALLLALVVGGIVLAIFLLETLRRSRERKATFSAAETAFSLKCESLGLDPAERQIIVRMARSEPSADPSGLLGNLSQFEHSVEREVQSLRQETDPLRKTEMEDLLFSLRKKLGFVLIDNDYPLVSTRNLAVGQPVMILGREPGAVIVPQARVVNTRELFFTVQYDARKETSLAFRRGDKIRIAFSRQGDAYYEAELTVAAFDRPGWIDFYHTLDLQRRQLRKDVRVDADFPLKFRLLEPGDPLDRERLGSLLHTARITDISGGGLCLLQENEVKPNGLLSLNFNLPQTPLTGIQAKVLRVSPQPEHDETRFRLHLQYVDLDPSQKDKIIKFVFERLRQRKQPRQ